MENEFAHMRSPYDELNNISEQAAQANESKNNFIKLCYEVFVTHPPGAELMKCWIKDGQKINTFDPSSQNASSVAIYQIGIRDFINQHLWGIDCYKRQCESKISKPSEK